MKNKIRKALSVSLATALITPGIPMSNAIKDTILHTQNKVQAL